MARIRSAKPEFWTDPLMTSLSRDVRFTFKGIFEVCADDFGRFLGDPRLVKSQIWPCDDDLSVKRVSAILNQLDELGRIRLYKVGGVTYGQVVNWSKHQRVDHPSPSRIPPESLANDSRTPREEFPSDSRPRARGGDRIGREGKGKEGEGVVKEGASNEPGSPAPAAAQLNENGKEPSDPRSSMLGRAVLDAWPTAPELPTDPPEKPGPIPAPDSPLPPAAITFGKTFYAKGQATEARRADVLDQLRGVMTAEGVAFNGGIVRNITPARLSGACHEVLRRHKAKPLEDFDTAIAFLLVKLSDVSQDSPTEKAAVADAKVEADDRRTFAERQALADQVARERPDEDEKIRAAALKIFPGKEKDMAQPRESYRVSRLLALIEEGANV